MSPGEQARAAVEHTGLNAGQRDAVITMLTATTAMTALAAAAGAGKSHTMAEFARMWTSFTGRRVVGLAMAANAARVLASEGLAESYNIAEFLGKIEGSGELRRPVPLHENDVLVLDEASQLSTTDLAMVQEAARQAGARLQQASPESVVKAILERDDADLSATEQIRQAQEQAGKPATCSPCGPPRSGSRCTRASISRSKPASPDPKPGGMSGNTPAQSSSSGSAPPSSPGTTSTPSSGRSPPPHWTAPGPSPASCTAASSS